MSTLYVKKWLSKHGDAYFIKFNQNVIIQIFECYHSPSIGKFIYFAYNLNISNHNCDNSSLDNFNVNSEKNSVYQ